jgi:hypothetical protein
MKKTKSLTLLTICIFTLIFTLSGCTNGDSANEQTYSTPEKAIIKCLEASGIQATSEDLEDMILDSVNVNNIKYYLLKGTHELGTKQAVYVFLVGVITTEGDKYFCEKATADFSLESVEDVNDAEYTSYSQYIIPISDIYIHVGMIFNPKYQPYFMGKKLSLDEDNVFFCKTKEAAEDVEFRKI